MTPNNPQALVFDWDGTVVDLKRDWKRCMADAIYSVIDYPWMGYTDNEMIDELERTEGKHTNHQIEYLIGTGGHADPGRINRAIDTYNARMRQEAVSQIASYRRDVIVNQAIEPLLMSAKCPCYVVSGAPLEHIRDFANRLDLLKYFRQILAYDKRLRPDFTKANACQSVLDLYGNPNSYVWGFGDMDSDIKTYLGLGMRAFLVKGNAIEEVQ